MKRLAVLPIALALAVGCAAQPDDAFAQLRGLVGKWEGTAAGQPGKGLSTREYRFELNERFLSEHGKIVWEPKSEAEKAAVHEDFGWFSYDRNLKKLVWRQFHDEGFVNEYTLDSAGADGKSLDFVSVRIENIAPGFRAKESLRMLSADELEAKFWLAAPGKDFEVFVRSHLKRVKPRRDWESRCWQECTDWRAADLGRSRLLGGQGRAESRLRAGLPALQFVQNRGSSRKLYAALGWEPAPPQLGVRGGCLSPS